MSPILTATVCVALIGLIIGILLVNLGRKFAVEVDPKEEAVRSALPGNNCGACGYAGCDAMAAAIARGEAPVNGCPVGGDPVGEVVAQIMGVEMTAAAKKVAFVKCSGDCERAEHTANYVGINDCRAAVSAGLDAKGCKQGCLGFGSCEKACPFDAIHVINGVAYVNRVKCRACGKCVSACPKQLIEILPDLNQYAVACSNTEKGKAVKAVCSAGCIGCGICVKQCENDAVHVTSNLSKIDYDKCQNCGKCAEKCPVKVISKRYAD